MGHRISQYMFQNSRRMIYLRHANELQPLHSADNVLPELSHNFAIEWQKGKDLLILNENRWFVRTSFDEGDDKFFGYLHLATQSSRQHRWFLSWVYSLSALDNLSDETFKPAVYLQIALSSANLCISPESTWMAMEEASKDMIDVGMNWEWAVVYFRICTVFGLFNYTNSFFEDIEKRIPQSSAWYDSLISCYLTSLMHQIENEFIRDLANYNIGMNEKIQSDELKLKLHTWLKVFNDLCQKLSTPGVKHYYTAYSYVYKSFIRATRRSTMDSLARGLQSFIQAFRELPKTDVRSVESNLMSMFLTNENDQAHEVSMHWNEYTKSTSSVLKAETWLRMALINTLTKKSFVSIWFSSKIFLTNAIENYEAATLSSGYRIQIMKNAKKYLRKNFQITEDDEIIINHHYASTDWTEMWSEQDVGTALRKKSEAFLRSPDTQQAFCIGRGICNTIM